MDRIPIRKPSPTETPNGDQAVAAFRIRFVAEAQPGAKVRRLFKQPRIAVAVEETIWPHLISRKRRRRPPSSGTASWSSGVRAGF